MAAGAQQAPARRQALIPLGRWFGIEVGADASWLIVFLLVTLSLASRLASEHPGWASAQHWTLGIVTSALFFLSIILHELGHSLVAVRLGVPVRAITLFVFGGVALLEKEPERPRDELAIAVAGPAVSLVLALVYYGAARAIPAETVFGSSVRWLAQINLALFAFNLIPGFPLDGGRVLRAALWSFRGSLTWATSLAAKVGAFFAYGFMAWGLVVALLSGQLFHGLWLGFIGWFLLSAARSSGAQSQAREALVGVPVTEIMETRCDVIAPDESLETIVERGVLRRGQRCFLVGSGGLLSGLLTVHEIREVPRAKWGTTPVRSAMVRLDALETLSPSTNLFDALRTMDETGVHQMPVVSDGKLVGMLTRERLLAVLRNHLEFRV